MTSDQKYEILIIVEKETNERKIMITITKKHYEPKVMTDMDKYDNFDEDVYNLLNTHKYVIVSTTINGGYFQSPSYDNYQNAEKDYKLFLGIIVYFGSGNCSMYEYNSIGDVELVKHDVI